MMTSSMETSLVILHYAYPATVFLYYIITSLISACNLQAIKKAAACEVKRPGWRTVVCLFALFLLTYVTQLAAIGTHSFVSRGWPLQDHIVIGHLSCILVFGIQLSQLLDAEYLAIYPFVGSWALALVAEVSIVAISAGTSLFKDFETYEIIDIVMVSLRCTSLLSLIGLFTVSFATVDQTATDEERQSLLPKTTTTSDNPEAENQANGTTGYGSTTQTGQSTEETTEETPEYNWERREREAKEAMKKRLEEGGNWLEYAKGFKVIFSEMPFYNIPYLSAMLLNCHDRHARTLRDFANFPTDTFPLRMACRKH